MRIFVHVTHYLQSNLQKFPCNRPLHEKKLCVKTPIAGHSVQEILAHAEQPP
jgi:hypothetical protein